MAAGAVGIEAEKGAAEAEAAATAVAEGVATARK
jgi:hypothetical protein